MKQEINKNTLTLTMKDINGSDVISSIKGKLREIKPMSLAINTLDELRQIKKLTFQQWHEALTTRLGIELDEISLFYCRKRFSNFEHIFDINNFANLMDIAPPVSYIDPTLNEDILPQPYRMISQIVEENIVDSAWIIITRLHTEILLDSDGKPLCIPRNQSLQNTCCPTHISEKIANVTSINAATINNYVFLATSENVFSVYDPVIDRNLHTITLLNSDDDAENSPKCISPWRISSLSDIDDVDSTIRVIVFCTIQTMEKKEPPPDPKAKKGAAVEHILTPCTKGYIAVVEVLLDRVSKPGTLSHDCLRIIATMQFLLADEAFESRLVCNISVDGQLVSVSSDTGCFVYELPSVIETKLQFKKMMEITEESEDQPQISNINTFMVTEPICQMPKYSSAEGVSLKAVALVPIRLPLTKNTNNIKKSLTKDTNTHAATAAVNEYNKTGLVILFDSLKLWELIGFKTKQDSDDSPKSCQNTMIGSWKLPGIVTAYQLSAERAILALGLEDGSVTIWNLLARSMTAVVARHEMWVSSLSFSQSNSGNYLISGAFDGTVCFHQIIGPKDTTPSFPGSDDYGSSSSALTTCVSTKMIDYRSDMATSHVSAVTLVPGFPIAIVQYWLLNNNNNREIVEVVYDVQNGALLGKLSLYYGIHAQGVDFHPLGVDEIYHNHNYLREGQLLNNIDTSLSYNRRAKKYEEFISTYDGVYFNRCVSTCSGDRLHSITQKHSKAEPLKSLGIYFSVNLCNGKQVLCAYSLRTLLSFYPGISTLCLRSEDLNAEYLNGRFPFSEKMDPTLTAEKRSLLQSLINDRGDLNRDMKSRQSDFGSKTNTPTSRLTKENLKSMSFSHSQSQSMSLAVSKIDAMPTLLQQVGERVMDVDLLASLSIQNTQNNTKMRKKRLQNRLKEYIKLLP